MLVPFQDDQLHPTKAELHDQAVRLLIQVHSPVPDGLEFLFQTEGFSLVLGMVLLNSQVTYLSLASTPFFFLSTGG